MNFAPFVCSWKNNYVEVNQQLKDIIHPNGIFNVINSQLCKNCGNPSMLNVLGKSTCIEDKLHERITDIDEMVQLGYYYKKSSMFRKIKKDILNDYIWGLKKDPEYAIPFAQAMYFAIKEKFSFLTEVDTIVPVPNHPEDPHQNAKAVALSSELCKQYNLDGKTIQVTNALNKIKNISLRFLDDEEKEKEVQGMYEFNSTESVKNKKVLLIDDILTRGFQKGRCATILKQNGAHSVFGFVVGRTT